MSVPPPAARLTSDRSIAPASLPSSDMTLAREEKTARPKDSAGRVCRPMKSRAARLSASSWVIPPASPSTISPIDPLTSNSRQIDRCPPGLTDFRKRNSPATAPAAAPTAPQSARVLIFLSSVICPPLIGQTRPEPRTPGQSSHGGAAIPRVSAKCRRGWGGNHSTTPPKRDPLHARPWNESVAVGQRAGRRLCGIVTWTAGGCETDSF